MRLIDNDALYQELLINKPAWVWANYTVDDVVKQVLDIVKAQPTVDAVKHGHWNLSRKSAVCNNYVCSVCGYGFGTNSNIMPRFCSECGAKMK